MDVNIMKTPRGFLGIPRLNLGEGAICTVMMTLGPSSARAAATGSQRPSDASNRAGSLVALGAR